MSSSSTTFDDQQLYFSILATFFQQLDLISEKSGNWSISQIARSFVGYASVTSSNFDEALVYAMLLTKMEMLDGKALRLIAPEGSVSINVAHQVPEIRLISRVCSLVSPAVSPSCGEWTGDIDRELAAFNSLVKAVQRSLRNLLEAVVVDLAVQNGDKLAGKAFTSLSKNMAFAFEPSVAGGCLMKSFLQGASVSDLRESFPQIASIEGELLSLVDFWSRFCQAVSYSDVDANTKLEVEAADAFLKNALKGTPFEVIGSSTSSTTLSAASGFQSNDAPRVSSPELASLDGTSDFNDAKYWKEDHSFVTLDESELSLDDDDDDDGGDNFQYLGESAYAYSYPKPWEVEGGSLEDAFASDRSAYDARKARETALMAAMISGFDDQGESKTFDLHYSDSAYWKETHSYIGDLDDLSSDGEAEAIVAAEEAPATVDGGAEFDESVYWKEDFTYMGELDLEELE